MRNGDRGPDERRLAELARVFLKLGATAFGGPAAHIAMMEDEVVRRRGWLTRAEFLDLLGATNLIPGPNSTEMAIHVGRLRAGWRGLLVAGTCFIVPAASIVLVIAWAYVRFGSLPDADRLLYGVKPVVIAIVAQALWGLGRTALKRRSLRVLGALAVAAVAAGVHELLVLLFSGVAIAAFHRLSDPDQRIRSAAVPILPALPAPLIAAGLGAAVPVSLWTLFLVFAKTGALLFGSGYVLLAFLRADLVQRLHWLSESQLLDAVAVGQVTPGPVFTTATFVGYVLAGPIGASVATVGIFLPAFLFVAASGPLVPWLRASPTAGAVLDGVNVASLALMAVVAVQLGRAAIVDPTTAILALLSGALLLRYRVSSAWLVLAGAVIGLAVARLGL
jgi:chromate transporter